MALNRKTFKKTAAAADTNLPSGYFNTVTYTGNGSTQKIGGYINRAALFNGSSSLIALPESSAISQQNNFTLSFWVKPSGFVAFGTVLTLYSDYRNYVDIRTNGILGFDATGSQVNTPSGSITDGVWQHIAITKSSTGGTVIYVNGTAVVTDASDTGNASDFTSNSYPNTVGAYKLTGSASDFFPGSIDQIRFFNKALSSTEVTTLYGETFASASKTVTDIFSDGSGIALYRLDGNANDEGGVSGYIGEGAIFNGGSSRIALGSASSLVSTNFSFSAWIKTTSATTDYVVGTNINPYTSKVTIRSEGDGRLRCLYGNYTSSEDNFFSTFNTINNGNWHHIVYFINQSTAKLYINGSLDTTHSLTVTPTASGDLTLATLYSDSSNSYSTASWNGQIDQVRIYDKELSSSEVTTLYGETASSNITISDLVAYYPFNGNSLDAEGSYNGTDTNVEYNYSGTATNVTYQDATNFTPDLVWVKTRNDNKNHVLVDSVRGVSSVLEADTSADAVTGYSDFTSFDSNGFTLGAVSAVYMNPNGTNMVSWCFNAGGSPTATNSAGAGNSPTSGSVMIDGVSSSAALGGNVEAKKMSVNTNAQFSIVEFTSVSGSTNQVPHGLNGVPDLFIFKKLAGSTGSGGWWAYTQVIDGSLDYFALNTTEGKSNSSETAPTATAVYQPTSTAGRDYILYSFKNVDGIQKVGSYTGTGSSSGNFVETEFEPAFLMIKESSASGNNWVIYDNKRDPINSRYKYLSPNTADSEGSNNASNYPIVNFLSNGFELAGTDGRINTTGNTYIYLAIAADADTTTPTVENSFEVVTYAGDGNDRDINIGFKPDFVWIKERSDSAGYWHYLFNSIRGGNKPIHSNATNAESVNDNNGYLSSFNDDGFSITSGSLGMASLNGSGKTYVAWCWKAGDHDDNLPQINTEGTIDSIVSVNDAAGFSIVKWVGTYANDTVGHGLSSAPELIIAKNLDTAGGSGTYDGWPVYASAIGNDQVVTLNSSAEKTSSSGTWGSTTPTSTVFTVQDNNDNNKSGDNIIAYCFTSITGYQKIGSYSSDGSNKTVNVGFRPRWIMIKNYSSAGNYWVILDSLRTTGTNGKNRLYANDSYQEDTSIDVSFNANDFTLLTSNGDVNGSGKSYIYLAIK